MAFIGPERPPLIAPLPASVQQALSESGQMGDHARMRGDRGHHRSIGHGAFGEHRPEHFPDTSLRSVQTEQYGASHGHHTKNHGSERHKPQAVFADHSTTASIEHPSPLKQDIPLYTAFSNLAQMSPDRITDAPFAAGDAWNLLADSRHTQTIVDDMNRFSQDTLTRISHGDVSAMSHVTGMKENHDMLLKLAPKGTLKELKNAVHAVIASWDSAAQKADEQSLQQLLQAVQDAGRNNPAAATYAAIEASVLGISGFLAAKKRPKEALALLSLFVLSLQGCVPTERPPAVQSIHASLLEQSITSIGASFDIVTTTGLAIPTHITAADCTPGSTTQPTVIEFTGPSSLPSRSLALCDIDIQIGSQPANRGAVFTEVIDGQVGHSFIFFGNPDSQQREGELVLLRNGQAVRGSPDNMTYIISTDQDGKATAMDITGKDGLLHADLKQAGSGDVFTIVFHPDTALATDQATVTATQTETLPATATIEPTKTPEIVRPTIDVGLSVQNNASMVLENGTWVTKNAAGQTTATWDGVSSEWKYNWETIKVQIGAIAMPTTVKGQAGGLDPSVNFVVPSEWKIRLPEDSIDPNPLVEQGFLGTHTIKAQSGVVITFADFGVDYRGIVLAEPAGDGHTSIDRYVAAFTVIDKNHPDILYVLTMPIIDTNSMTSYLDILPNGTFTFETSDPPEIGVKGSVLIDILQNPSTVGRRMVISIRISETASNYNDVELTPDNKRLAEAIQNGSILTGSLDIRLTLRNLHIPHDLHP